MATRGRKPKPASVKRCQGNPGKRRLNDLEPQADARAPTMPQHFDAEGKKAWRWLVKTLRGMAILAASDVALMTLYCDSWSQYIAIRSELAAKGVSQFILHCKVKGTFYRNPLVDTEAMLKKQLMMCLTELGLSPISRARLQVRPQESNDPMAELLAVIHARRTHASKN